MSSPFRLLEQKAGYEFVNPELLKRALTHRSFLSERAADLPETSDNEQLEFLGDSVLGFLVSEALVAHQPNALEGQLSKWKAHLVSATHLHQSALRLGLGDHLRLGKGEDRNGGRGRKTLLANALEAVIAAIYLDGGIASARKFINEHVLSLFQNPEDLESVEAFNHKSTLQELTQALRLPTPRYVTVETSGPEHAKIFKVEVQVGDCYSCRAEGTSKKSASQLAAQSLMQELQRFEHRDLVDVTSRNAGSEIEAVGGV